MKKRITTSILIILSLVSLHGTNLDNIYGKNDLNMNKSRGELYGNNFGSILDYDSMPPMYVDVPSAQKEIDTLGVEINLFNDEVTRYESQISADRRKREEIRDLIGKIDMLLIDLKGTSADLYLAKQGQNDSEMRQKIQTSIEENRRQIYSLNNKKSELQGNVAYLNDRITVSNRFVTLNNLFVRKNDTRISYLKSCIDYTGRDTAAVDTLLEKSSSFQSEVDDLTNVSF